VRLLVVTMFRFKEKKVIDQELTILDFVRLLFEDCELSDLDGNQPFGFFSSRKWSLSKEDVEKKILRFGLTPAYQKTEEFNFYLSLSNECKSEKSNFPQPKTTKRIENGYITPPIFKFYLVSDILDWLDENLDEINLNIMPSWAKNYLTTKHESKNSLLNYDSNVEYVKIETLPKFIQLIIKTYLKTDWSLKPDRKAITKIAIEIAGDELNIPNTPTLQTGSGIEFQFPKKGDNSEESMSKKIMEVLPKIIKPDSQ
jgi:hypothetical protein